MSISSIVVQTRPEDLDTVSGELIRSGLCEIFFSDSSGKIIITVESGSTDDEMQKMSAIQDLPLVLSAQLAYSYYEGEETSSEYQEGYEQLL